MVDIQHKNIVGTDAAHPPFYASESDPTTTLGAYRGWFKPSTGQAWIRNAANTAWLDISITGSAADSTGLTDHLADTSDAHDASAISIVDAGSYFAATQVEAALQELGAGGGGGGAGHTIQDEGVATTARTNLNFTGAGVTVSDDAANDQTDVDIPGGTTDPASETVAGIAELATQTEVNTGTDTERIVTPATLVGRTATETRAGVIEIATQAETNAGTDDARSVTPAKLAARTATDTRAGVVELATDAETQTGTDTTRSVTPANLTARSATETRAGVIELATQAETNTGTDDARAITPLKLKTNVDLHINDTADAHDASAISFVPAGSVAATNVQTAIEEVASEAGGGGSAHTIKDEGSAMTQRANLNFIGAGVTVTDDAGNSETEVTIPGGSGYRTLVTLGSDVSNSTSSFADVTGLSFSVSSGTVYRFSFLILFEAQATSTGSAWSLNGPSFTNLAYSVFFSSVAAPTFTHRSAYDVGAATTTSATLVNNFAMIEGIVVPSASGTLVARFLSEAPGTNNQITAKAGSTLEWW